MLSERSHSQNVTNCDSIYMTLWKRQNFRNGRQISGLQGLGWGQDSTIGKHEGVLEG